MNMKRNMKGRPDNRTAHSGPSKNTQDSHTQSHKQHTNKKPRPTQCKPHCSKAVTLLNTHLKMASWAETCSGLKEVFSNKGSLNELVALGR
jgi:hypothetical protein